MLISIGDTGITMHLSAPDMIHLFLILSAPVYSDMIMHISLLMLLICLNSEYTDSSSCIIDTTIPS